MLGQDRIRAHTRHAQASLRLLSIIVRRWHGKPPWETQTSAKRENPRRGSLVPAAPTSSRYAEGRRTGGLPDFAWLSPRSIVPEQRQQDDDRKWNSEKPKQ